MSLIHYTEKGLSGFEGSAEPLPLAELGRVLLIAEEPLLTVTRATLEDGGFAVAGAANWGAALSSLRRSRPHVLVLQGEGNLVPLQELAHLLGQAQEHVRLIHIGREAATTGRRLAAARAGASDYYEMPAQQVLLLESLRQLVAVRQTMDRLRNEADRDYLTGLANRRRFRSVLARELDRWRHYRIPCALILLDLDFLKKINDRYGHASGDIAIRHVARALRDVSRENDLAARLGGEEFALLLTGTNEVQAAAAAERLRQYIENEHLDDIGKVTVSLGVAACPAHAVSERTLYASSDTALYRAKGLGRNLVCIAPPLNEMQLSIAS